MTIWPPQRQQLQRPVYRTLAKQVIKAIDSGLLRAGDRLPTQRQLAEQLGISVQTVSRAYDELIRAGVISGEIGRGTFIRAGRVDTATPFLPERQPDALIDCSLLVPVCAPLHRDRMRAALARLSNDLPDTALFSFRPSTALRAYRDTSVAWLKGCGVRTQAENVLLTNGSTAAMTLALMAAAGPGDLIVAEQLSHHTLKPLARYLGLRLKGLAFDEQGLLPDDFERACVNSAVKGLYLMPSGLNPTAAMMGDQRREALCAIAQRHNVMIIENDAWGPLQPQRPAPLVELAPERTFYFTSFTKCLMPGLRSGYLVVPEALSSATANRQLVSNWMATPLLAEIAARWIDDGTALELLRWQQAALAERNAVAARVLAGNGVRASPNGLHVWLPLPPPWREQTFVEHARLRGVAVAPGTSFALSDAVRNRGVRICLGGVSLNALEDGLAIVARLIRDRPEPALLAL